MTKNSKKIQTNTHSKSTSQERKRRRYYLNYYCVYHLSLYLYLSFQKELQTI
ncbi:transmembrane protein, putative (macronuclear) [Tetrahymena thermophila SB210]|uniref:Transmembrane protein, putative n=1 Tax=Tetrahymena thermophila (strain SB210) TaxID=312017 RepID=W7XKZ6_TETTS|nr:transmembrane protein, putative [Tetrahymena thermophila SB210]EWS75404.1 transmembrane protein, putative [Tetrahymena thermophila SB210]|eukprot:XP_012652078.1 transmembrane protein, putative [Tetrahymena thermophila SB210]